MPPDHRAKLGILAGGGRLPLALVETCREQDREFFVIVFEGQADPADFSELPHAVVRLGAAGKAIKHLKTAGCEELVMAGNVRRPSLKELRPDLWTVRFLARSGATGLGDDGMLTAIVRTLEAEEGFRIVGIDDLLPSILAVDGPYGAHVPDAGQQHDVDVAIAAAKDLGARDVGQAACARAGQVIALEDADGTDAMLARVTPPASGRTGALAKVKKPGQEARADLPTIGVETVEGAARAGLAGIAVEAGGALVVEREAMTRRADALGLFVVGVTVPPDPA
jgi:UDP-2,3-diacylglucosamine hydrolase